MGTKVLETQAALKKLYLDEGTRRREEVIETLASFTSGFEQEENFGGLKLTLLPGSDIERASSAAYSFSLLFRVPVQFSFNSITCRFSPAGQT